MKHIFDTKQKLMLWLTLLLSVGVNIPQQSWGL